MGKLIEQSIRSLFNGVSRQPHNVRLPSQLEQCINATPSVITSGVSKRGNTQHLAVLSIPQVGDMAVHSIERDLTEQYQVFIGQGEIRVFDVINREFKDVFTEGDQSAFLAYDAQFYRFVTVADYTFISNKQLVPAMLPAPESPDDGRGLIYFTTLAAGSQRSYSVVVRRSDGSVAGSASYSTSTVDINAVAAAIKSALSSSLPAGWTLSQIGPVLHITNPNEPGWYLDVTDSYSGVCMNPCRRYVPKFSNLPPFAEDGFRIEVAANPSSASDGYWVEFSTEKNVWFEIAAPGEPVELDPATMPRILVREADGSFTLKNAEWNRRKVGTTDLVPPPPFVGRPVEGIFYFRGRLGILSDEEVTFSQAGDVFNFWPDKTFEVLDSDPIVTQASTNRVTVLRYAVPFRKALFVSSDFAQFEVGTDDKLTPKSAAMTPTTSYEIDPLCSPVVMGDQLYFASQTDKAAVIHEYYYDGDSFTNTAADVTKHCLGYIPAGIRKMVADATSQRLFVLPNQRRDRIYVYTSYWAGTEKMQSAWSEYTFGEGAEVVDLSISYSRLFMLIKRDGVLCLESMTTGEPEEDSMFGFPLHLDRKVIQTGTYDPVSNTTSWSLPYADPDTIVVLGPEFAGQSGRILTPTMSGSTATLTGDYSAGEAALGVQYELRVELSKQYLREEQSNQIVYTGRCQMRDITFQYQQTGYFEVHVTPEARPTKVWKMTGKILGSINNVLGTPTVEEVGSYRVKVQSRSDSVKLEIVSSNPYPCVITGASWVGFYNNYVRAG